MIDFLFDIVCGDKYWVMAFTVIDGVLYAVPCDDTPSGYYGEYKEKVKLSNLKANEFIDIKFDNDNVDAVLFIKDIFAENKDELIVVLASDSHDGFQPV